jgi:hypothetical protein
MNPFTCEEFKERYGKDGKDIHPILYRILCEPNKKPCKKHCSCNKKRRNGGYN